MAKKVDKDCAVFVNTGSCSFGHFCKFRHPTLKNADQVEKEGNNGNASGKESDKSSPIMPCKFFQVGTCNRGIYCKFLHSTPAVQPERRQFNTLGLPYRLGEQDCSFYMRNGFCGYGLDCKYHHPDPVYDSYEQQENGHGFEYEYQSFGNTDGGYYPQAPLMTDSTVQPTINAWNGNQGMAVNNGFYGTNNYRPVQVSSLVLNEAGLPQRPGKRVCWHYERSGDCVYGSACAFDHPPKFSPASYADFYEGSTSQSALGDTQE